LIIDANGVGEPVSRGVDKIMNASMVNALHASGPGDRWSLASHRFDPRDGRCFLVAVASSGGTRIDGKFEEAESFLLYEKSGCASRFIGRQPCSLSTDHGDPVERTRLLADCDLVVCAGISDSCRERLSELGVGCELAHAGASVDDAVLALVQ
jgi:hypothetical protein